MSLKLYMDEHVPAAITDGLRQRGIDVLTVQEDGHAGLADAALLDRAEALGRVIFTRDTDFLREAAHRQQHGQPFAGVVYAHQLRVPIGTCMAELELLASCCDPDDLADRVEYLPLK